MTDYPVSRDDFEIVVNSPLPKDLADEPAAENPGVFVRIRHAGVNYSRALTRTEIDALLSALLEFGIDQLEDIGDIEFAKRTER